MRINRVRGRKSVAAACALITAGILVAVAWALGAASAQTQTLFSDNFEDGNANGWTSPRGQWQVCQQPGRSLAFCVTPTDGTYPISFTGSFGWTNYSVEAAVYMTGIDGGVSIIGRASDRSHFYMLQLKQYRKIHGWFIHRRMGLAGSTLPSATIPGWPTSSTI